MRSLVIKVFVIKQCMAWSTSLIEAESMSDLNKPFYPMVRVSIATCTNDEFKSVMTALSFSQFCDPST